MNKDRLNKITILVNKIFMLTGNKPCEDMASVYAEEITEYNVPIIPKDMRKYVISNHKGFGYPPVTLFLDSLGIMSESEKLATACDFAWNSAVQLMPWMKESTNYNCPNNPYMLYALNKIGVKRIISAQEFVDSKTNRINPYQLSSFKKEFERYFTEALNNNLQIEQIEGSGSLVKEIAAPKPNQALLGSLDSPLKALNDDVKRIGENVMQIIEGRK